MIRDSGAGPLSYNSASPRRPGPLPLEGVGGRRRGADGSPPPTEGGTRHATGPTAGSQSKCQSFGCDPIALHGCLHEGAGGAGKEMVVGEGFEPS